MIGLADAGILHPAVSVGIPFPTDPGELLSPADHVESCAVDVTDLDELSELGTFAGKMEDEVQSPLCCYLGDSVDFWDPVMMAKEMAWMNFRFIMVAICGIQMVLTLAIRTTMMISRNYLTMKTPGIFFAMSG